MVWHGARTLAAFFRSRHRCRATHSFWTRIWHFSRRDLGRWNKHNRNGISARQSNCLYRWTASTGFENLGLFPGSSLIANDSYAQGLGISGDGSIIVGYGRASAAAGQRAFLWTASAHFVLLPSPVGSPAYQANAISADGGVIAGKAVISGSNTRWSCGMPPEPLRRRFPLLVST